MKRKLPDSAFERSHTAQSKREGIHIHRCLRELFSILPKPKRILELFGGLGDITAIAREFYPDLEIESWDLDTRCVAVLSTLGIKAVQGNSIVLCTPREGDGVLIDHNHFTLKIAKTNFSRMIQRILAARPSWVQINDCAVSKLHLNYRRYGAKGKTLQDYLDAYDEAYAELGYRIIAHAGHARATQIVLGRIE